MGERKLFHIYVDEAHRFVNDAIDDLISECRKFSLTARTLSAVIHPIFSSVGNSSLEDSMQNWKISRNRRYWRFFPISEGMQ